MKALIQARILACAAALLVAAPALAQHRMAESRAAPASRGQLLLPEFAALADKASETVNVTLDQRLLGLGCRFLNAGNPEEAQAKKLCTSLRGIYVRHFTFDSDFAYPKADIERVRRQLSAPGWSQIVGAVSKKDKTDVDVYVLIDGDQAQGLSIIASQPREFTIVNIVGSIDLEQLHALEGNFGVPELQIETSKPPAKDAPKKK
jgi:hypothetical protein